MAISDYPHQSIARRTRRSPGASPNAQTVVDQENATTAFGSSSFRATGRTKSRSKSLGPGGLEALKVGSGNRRASFAASTKVLRSILKPSFAEPYGSTCTDETQRHSQGPRVSPRKSTPRLDAVDENDSNGLKIAVRTEEEQQAAAREKEERDRRDAHRKSLVNRRVSFATEATLHTFHENEYAQDSTTSTDDSRRLSSTSQAGQSSKPSLAESVNQQQRNDPVEAGTTANDQLLSKMESESSDAIFNNADLTTTSTVYSSDSEPMEEVEDVEDEFSVSDSDDGSVVTVDAQEVTGTTAASERTSAISGDSSLDEALRVAAQRATTHNFQAREVDGHGPLDDEKAIPSFDWAKRAASSDVTLSKDGRNPQQMAVEQDLIMKAEETDVDGMEMTRAVGQILRVSQASPPDDEENQTMDVTTAIGTIIRPPALFELPNLNDSSENPLHEETAMELTTALGTIYKPSKDLEEDIEDNENMSMELTSVMGGVLARSQYMANLSAHDGFLKGEVSPGLQELKSMRSSRDDEDITKGMEMTTAMGNILWKSEKSPLQTPPRSSLRSPTSSRRQSREANVSSEDMQSQGEQGQRTPKGLLSTPSANALPAPQISKASPSRRKSAVNMTPQSSKTHRIRRLSGFGADRSGLGSPQIAATFSRRGSIGDTAVAFKVGERSVTFRDPSDVVHRVERERQDQHDKEHQRKILEREVDGAASDASLSVQGLLGALSPNRKTNRSRKSLHIGSAKGLLGKRPAELDEDDDSEDNDGVKRLKGYQSSPVKSVRLQQPLKETELGYFRMRSPRKVPEAVQNDERTPSAFSPKIDPMTTPRHQKRFKDVSPGNTVPEFNFEEVHVADVAELERQVEEEKIHLQDFLNLTSIRFMELTTTKRRHTVVPDKDKDRKPSDESDALSLERCVVASACVVPMLELYQHSCRELKKYIFEGRQMMKEIEKDTFEQNPPLFREYMTASPEVKSLMDGQFKNVKTHARLQSKAMWYEWRMKLQDGLMEGLAGIAEGMKGDQEAFQQQRNLIQSVLPAIVVRHRSLEEQCLHLREAAQELAGCDQSQLDDARQELIALGEDMIQKEQMIAELRAQCDGWETQVNQLSMRKQEVVDGIEKAEAQREKDRGWTANEICGLQARVDGLEKQHGWALTGLHGMMLSLAYRRDVEFVVDAASFQSDQPSCRIDLWYIGDSRELNPVPKTVEKEVFIQCIRDHVRSLDQQGSSISELLQLVQTGWDRALAASYQVQRLNTTFPMQVTKTSDQSIAATVSMLSVPAKTRLEVMITLRGHGGPADLEIGISVSSRIVYGKHLNIARIDEFLTSRVGTTVQQGAADWVDVLSELKEKFMDKSKA